MPFVFDVDQGSPLPIYAQIVARVRRALAVGEIGPGEQLPTVRQLAVDLRINPNTVARAYADLEREGLIATRQGRGTFVSENPPATTPGERTARLESVIRAALEEAAAIGFRPNEFVRAMEEYVKARSEGD